jgi:glycosyltransferase involved in cell wall biosynthesis
VPVLRLIGRLNVGGPAIQAITLTRWLTERGYRTLLVCGVEGPREGNMDGLAAELDVRPRRLRSLRRDLGVHDLLALLAVLRILVRRRPEILHTHAAKAGTVGRTAALLLGRWGPPVRVHTFHGHVLSGYFGARQTRGFVAIERFLARHCTRLIAVSDEVRDDLVALGIADRERIEVIPVGFELSEFAGTDDSGARADLGLPADAPVVTLVARLVPIKRPDRFLRIARIVAARRPDAHFLIVGDGELHDELRGSAAAHELGERITWAGVRFDMPAIYQASDLVVLTSDNEGTPVSLIEAQAAARATVATDVGGVRSVVLDGVTGAVVAADAEEVFADAIIALLEDPDRRRLLGRRGREHVAANFGRQRLVDDLDALYRVLLAETGARGTLPGISGSTTGR